MTRFAMVPATLGILVGGMVAAGLPAGCSTDQSGLGLQRTDAAAGSGGATTAGGGVPVAGRGGSGGVIGSGGSTVNNGGTASGGVTAMGGSTPTGGSTGVGGATGGGGVTATGGSTRTGGATATGGSPPTGGATGAGGATGNGGSTGTGGSTRTGGTTGVGGSTRTGGATGVGGSTRTGGTTGAGGSTRTGGTTGMGGSSRTGGNAGAGGSTRTGGATGTGGTTGVGGSTRTGGTTASGGTTGTGGTGGTGKTCGGLAGLPCAAGEICDLPTGHCCCDYFGTCAAKPQVCAAVYQPVCGCDGRTYANDCTRQAAGVSKLSDGACATGDAGATTCGQVTTQAECDSRSDCHSVFVDPGTCGCASPGCCAHFNICANGGRANCTGPVLCLAPQPFCELPYVLSYTAVCYEGCVRQSECAGADAAVTTL
jgi:hypothetical protein